MSIVSYQTLLYCCIKHFVPWMEKLKSTEITTMLFSANKQGHYNLKK
jgi:hypothetical protein